MSTTDLITLGTIGFFIKKIMDKTESLEKSLKPIAPAIIEIQGKFTQAGHSILFPITVTPGSPLKLTDYGRDLLKRSGFDEALKKHRTDLVERVRAKKPKTNYDIQQYSTAVIQELLNSDDPIAIDLKNFAFNNGMLIDIFVPPAGIVLRDEVMKDLKL